MKFKPRDCPTREELFAYSAEMLGAEEGLAINLHLSECDCCRKLVEDYRGVNTVLNEWNAPEPSLGFDSRLRRAVERTRSRPWFAWWQKAMYRAWDRIPVWSGGMPSIHSVGPALLLAVVILCAVVLVRVRGKSVSNRGTAHLTFVTAPNQEGSASGSAPAISEVPPSGISIGASPTAEAGPTAQDDEMLANFDVLSELPVPHERIEQRDN
jgi:hypothetical protein